MGREALAGVVTWLYVPADQRPKLDKALTGAADAVLADLEDAVAPASKPMARATLRDWLAELPDSRTQQRPDTRPAIWVRINATSITEDLAVAIHPAVTGICLPKVETPAALAALDAELAATEASARRGAEPLAIMAMIETARGVVDCASIAAGSDRLVLLQLGEQDLSADLRLPPSLDPAGPLPSTLQAARNTVVLASAAAGLLPPIGPVSTVIHDVDVLTAEAGKLRRDGFGGRATIHPAQLGPTMAGFAPSDADLGWADRVVAADADATASGRGVTVVDGRMVDAPVVAQARAILRAR